MCDKDCRCSRERRFCKIHVKEADIKRLKACNSKLQSLCVSDQADISALNVEDQVVNNLCVANDFSAKNANCVNFNSNNLCAQVGTINTLCVDNLTANAINSCMKWRATATFAADAAYSLGDDINWDTIIDDPNNNIALAPFSYTVPKSGYYILDFYLRSDTLSSPLVISGIPVGLVTVTKNGSELRQVQAPYLSFASAQHANLGALAILQAGDIIKMKYEVLILDPASGLISVPGTISIKAQGATPGFSRFEIHYLSSLDCMPGQGQACKKCPLVNVACQPIVVDCDDDNDDDDCSSDSYAPCR